MSRRVDRYRKIARAAWGSRKGLVTFKEGVELSDLLRIIIREK